MKDELLHQIKGYIKIAREYPDDTAANSLLDLIHSRESQLFKEVEKILGNNEVSPYKPGATVRNKFRVEQRQRLAQLRKEWGK